MTIQTADSSPTAPVIATFGGVSLHVDLDGESYYLDVDSRSLEYTKDIDTALITAGSMGLEEIGPDECPEEWLNDRTFRIWLALCRP